MVNYTEMKKLSVISLIFSLLFIFSCEDDKDTTPPELTILSPTLNSTVGEVVNVKIETSDKSGILKVDFFVDNKNTYTDTITPYEYDWNTTEVSDGVHTIKVQSYDTEENMSESEVSVTVDNESKKPSPLDIVSVTYTPEKMTVKWNESQETDFKHYNLYYSLTESGTKSLVQTFTNKSTTLYDTTTFDPSKENWFFLEVVDTYDLSKMGSGKTNDLELPPTPLDIISVDYDLEKMTVKWNESQETDFKHYNLYHSLTENGNRTLIETLKNKSTTYFDTTMSYQGLTPSNENWFYLEVVDMYDLSNIGSGKTNEIDSPPTKPEIFSVEYYVDYTRYEITWKENSDLDFEEYRLYVSEYEDMRDKSEIFFSSDPSKNKTDEGESPWTGIKYFQLEVTDKWYLKSVSDVKKGDSNLWFNKTFGGDLDEGLNDVIEVSVGEPIHLEMNKRYTILGWTESYGLGSKDYPDVWFFQVDSKGNKVWEKTFGGQKKDMGHSMITTSDGGYIIVGEKWKNEKFGNDYSDFPDIWLIKTDSQGNLIWEKTYGGSKSDYGYSVVQSTDGGFVVTGSTNKSEDFTNYLFILKTDSFGQEEWFKTYDSDEWSESTRNGLGYRIFEQNGDYIVLGRHEPYSLNEKFLGIKFNYQGEIVWKKVFDSGRLTDGIKLKNGGFLMTGYHDNSNSSIYLPISEDGNRLGGSTYQGGTVFVPLSIREDYFNTNEGRPIEVIGYNSLNSNDVTVKKLDGSFSSFFERSFPEPNTELGKSSFTNYGGGLVIFGENSELGKRRQIWLFGTDPNFKYPNK